MDASQYKDYVLVLLFIKYISDKYAGVPYAPITVPKGASFKDMVALKGNPNIGDDINKKIIGKIAEANKFTGTIDVADFNNSEKLGSGKEMVERLTNLIAIFEDPALDFSQNRAEGDDILGVKASAAPSTTIYDPTCGSGSLLLKIADEADRKNRELQDTIAKNIKDFRGV